LAIDQPPLGAIVLSIHTGRMATVLREGDLIDDPGRRWRAIGDASGETFPDGRRIPIALIDELLQGLI
jgi:hypothetical protein